MSREKDITQLLQRARTGDEKAFSEVYELVYDQLKNLARKIRYRESRETLNTTALVHEAYLKLTPNPPIEWNDSTHFYRIIARTIRHVLVDAARYHKHQKRGGGKAKYVEFENVILQTSVDIDTLLTIDMTLESLEEVSSRQVDIVNCHLFAGFSQTETAEILGISDSTVKREWRKARAKLQLALQ